MTPWTRFVRAFQSTQPVVTLAPAVHVGDWARDRLATVRAQPRVAPIESTRTDRILSREQVASMTQNEIATALGRPDLYAMTETVIAPAF